MSSPDPPPIALPPQSSVKSVEEFLALLENRKVPKVDKNFLQKQGIARGNENKLISGLKFIGLIDKDGNSTEKMDQLSVVGEKRKENLAAIVRTAYSLIFEEISLDLKKIDPDTLINAFKKDYKMGSIDTATRGVKIFVFLAQKAGIVLSQQITDNLSVDPGKAKKISDSGKRSRPVKPKSKSTGETQEISLKQQLPLEALARFILKDVGYVDIKDKGTFDLAKAYMKVLAKKIGLDEED